LLEPQRTNSLLYSNDFTHSSWQKFGATITGSQSDPFNGTAAFKLELAAGSSYIYQPAGTGQRSNSIWMRADAPLFVGFSSGGTIGSGVNITTTWQRYTYTHSDLGGMQIDNYFFSGQPVQQAKTLYIYQAQVEAGAYATSPIFTTTAAVTRLADAASKTGITSLIGQTEGTLYWEGEIKIGEQSRLIFCSDGSSSNFINTLVSTSGEISAAIRASLVTSTAFTSSPLTAGVHKIAFAYKANDSALYIDGVSISGTSGATVPATSRLDIGSRFGTDSFLNSGTSQALLFKTRLSNDKLAEITSL
jgi:hypothetical protein